MQSVCDQLPATLPEYLQSTGYHRQCYQRFTGNLHFLGDAIEPEASISLLQSPRRHSAVPIFPPERIFCEKVEMKGVYRKTERPVKFSSWKSKENAWQQIESRAEKWVYHDFTDWCKEQTSLLLRPNTVYHA